MNEYVENNKRNHKSKSKHNRVLLFLNEKEVKYEKYKEEIMRIQTAYRGYYVRKFILPILKAKFKSTNNKNKEITYEDGSKYKGEVFHLTTIGKGWDEEWIWSVCIYGWKYI